MNILFIMILFHIIDDFCLQPISLSKLKQKNWWINEAKKQSLSFEKYKYDYLMALFIHSLSWSIMIHLPFILMFNINDFPLFLSVFINMLIHFTVDDLKANRGQINLIHDQIIHLIQIIITFIILI